MGWAGGTYIATAVIDAAVEHVPDQESRTAFYVEFIRAMRRADWDTVDEAIGRDEAFDDALERAEPDWFLCECGANLRKEEPHKKGCWQLEDDATD